MLFKCYIFVFVHMETSLSKEYDQWQGCSNLESKLEKMETAMNRKIEKLQQVERQIYDKWVVVENIAYGKVAQQSSTANEASLAIDGSKNTISHTHYQYHPYWIVDLGHVNTIQRIEIYNRPDCCGERLHDLEITVGSSQNEMSLCTHYKGPSTNGEPLIFKCQQQIRGRFVRLRILGTEYLQLAEVEIYAPVLYNLSQ